MNEPKITFRVHAVQRMFERGISIEQIRTLVEQGNTIESRPDDSPFPSRLVHLHIDGHHLHAVLADDPEANEVFVITVYEPDSTRWDPTRTRRVR